VTAPGAIEILKHHSESRSAGHGYRHAGGMNGRGTRAESARVLRPDLKIIYSSGFPAEALAERSMSLVDGPLLHNLINATNSPPMIHHVMDIDYATPGD